MLSDRFRAAVERGDLSGAAELFSQDATFRSPVLFKPYEGRDQIFRGSDLAFRAEHRRSLPLERGRVVAIIDRDETGHIRPRSLG